MIIYVNKKIVSKSSMKDNITRRIPHRVLVTDKLYDHMVLRGVNTLSVKETLDDIFHIIETSGAVTCCFFIHENQSS